METKDLVCSISEIYTEEYPPPEPLEVEAYIDPDDGCDYIQFHYWIGGLYACKGKCGIRIKVDREKLPIVVEGMRYPTYYANPNP